MPFFDMFSLEFGMIGFSQYVKYYEFFLDKKKKSFYLGMTSFSFAFKRKA